MVAFWGIRLTFNWLKGWDGMHKQDWRYIKLSNDTGKFYWLVSFLGIHLLPTLVVFAGLLPCWFILSSAEPLNIWDGVVATITIGFVVVEWVADWQLSRFKRENTKDTFINEGLWAFSRHPNYLGEIGFWLGIFLFLLSSKVYSGIWTVIGFLLMVMLFNFISIPMMDKRNLERREGYKEYMKSVPSLFPDLRRRI
jgi:steroid 5-alpha reductase family enzyme